MKENNKLVLLMVLVSATVNVKI